MLALMVPLDNVMLPAPSVIGLGTAVPERVQSMALQLPFALLLHALGVARDPGAACTTELVTPTLARLSVRPSTATMAPRRRLDVFKRITLSILKSVARIGRCHVEDVPRSHPGGTEEMSTDADAFPRSPELPTRCPLPVATFTPPLIVAKRADVTAW